MARKTVYAPPSVKLGITLVSARGGPVIYELQPGSPLEGQVRVGWRLVAIGCKRCSGLSAPAAVELLRCGEDPQAVHFETDPYPPCDILGAICFCGIDLVILGISALWLMTLVHSVPGLLTATWFYFAICGLYNQWACCYTGPGFTTADTGPCVSYCGKCNLGKPRLARHCSTCGRCVLDFDHHCNWVGGCVGRLNYRYFLMLEMHSCLAAATVGLAAVSRAAHLGWCGWAWAWVLLSLVFCGICAMYVRCICLHIHLLSAGQTTIDYLHPTENGDGAELGEECVGLAAPKRRDARERQEAIFGLHRSCQWNCAATVWRVAVRWCVASPWFRALVWALRVY